MFQKAISNKLNSARVAMRTGDLTKKVLMSGLMVAGLFTFPGCTGEQTALVGGLVGGAVIGSVVANQWDNKTCHGGYRTVCENYTNYYGYGQNKCRRVWDSCAYYDRTLIGKDAVSPRAEIIANKYNLSISAGQKIERVIEASRKGDSEAFKSLGFTDKNLADLASMRAPAAADLDETAKILDVSKETTHAMLKDVVQTVSAQVKDVQSPFWQSCMADKSWRTEKNSNCQEAFWPGCSPSTGALACMK